MLHLLSNIISKLLYINLGDSITVIIIMFIAMHWENKHLYGSLEWIDVPETWVGAFLALRIPTDIPIIKNCPRKNVPTREQMYVVTCKTTYQQVNVN